MGLREWLAGLDETRLTRLLSRRPDVIAPPWPRRLDDLEERLTDPAGAREASQRLPLPALQVLEAAQITAGLHDLAGFLGCAPDRLEPFLELLEDHGLAWRAGGRLHHRETTHHPLRLGRPVEHFLLWQSSPAAVRNVATHLGLPADGAREDVADRIAGFYRDPHLMGLLLKVAPDGVPELLNDLAWHGPERIASGIDQYVPGRGSFPVHWAMDRGLVWRIDWGRGHMPREVALAVRGPDYRAPFTPEPPEPPTVPAGSAGSLEHDAAAAAARTLDRAAALLDGAARSPVPLLKAGGVGVREIRRIARELGCEEEETRLHLEVAAAAGLIGNAETGGLAPTPRYDKWLNAAPDMRLRLLLAAWWRTERSPLLAGETDGRPPPALGEWPYGGACRAVRHAAFALLAEIPPGRGCRDTEAMARAIAWRAPLLGGLEPASALAACLTEAAVLGLMCDGALSGLGRALATSEEAPAGACAEDALAGACAEVLERLHDKALFGADLTAVVTGPPAPDLAALLDLAGDRESQGAGTVWRFGPESVRRALDAGAADLVSRLESVATSGGLPQPLIYLVRDVERRHGEVAVVGVSSVVRSEDPALIKEIAASRRLDGLGLRMIADTVLISRTPAEQVLTALRAAGYGPVPALPDGAVVVDRAGHRAGRQDTPENAADLAEVIHNPDPAAHARRLLAAERAPSGSVPTWSTLRRRASHLPPSASSLLGLLIEHDIPARVRLEDGTERLVSHGELDDDVIEAWSHETGGYERFRLTDITAVHSP